MSQLKQYTFTMRFTFQTEATGVVLHLLRQHGLEADQDKQGEVEDGTWCNWECRYISAEKYYALQAWADAAKNCGLIRNPTIVKKERTHGE